MHAISQALLAPEPGSMVLDAGCGTGANLPWLRQVAADNVVHGTDISAAGLAVCQASGATPSLTRASVSALPYRTHQFDLVVSADVVQHLPSADVVPALRD